MGILGSTSPEERRFSQVYAEDRVGPMPYPNQASPDVAAARGRVRALVNDLLPGGVDEGTGAALDPLIASWASGWLSRIDSQHADHHAVVDRLVGGARRQLADAEAAHERDRRALEIARTDYSDARERLIEPSASPATSTDPAARPGNRERRGGRSVFGRVGDRLTRRSGPGGAPTGGERVGPSEPATRPVRIPPTTYGSTFDEPFGRSSPPGPAYTAGPPGAGPAVGDGAPPAPPETSR